VAAGEGADSTTPESGKRFLRQRPGQIERLDRRDAPGEQVYRRQVRAQHHRLVAAVGMSTSMPRGPWPPATMRSKVPLRICGSSVTTRVAGDLSDRPELEPRDPMPDGLSAGRKDGAEQQVVASAVGDGRVYSVTPTGFTTTTVVSAWEATSTWIRSRQVSGSPPASVRLRVVPTTCGPLSSTT